MPKPRRLSKNRQTTKVYQNKNVKRKQSDGRPVGTLKRYLFEETKLGFFLKNEAPTEFDLLMQSSKGVGCYIKPEVALIKFIARTSPNPSFLKNKFKKYLEEYKLRGLCVGVAVKMTPTKALYYEAQRKTKLANYIKDNIQRINMLTIKMQIEKGIG